MQNFKFNVEMNVNGSNVNFVSDKMEISETWTSFSKMTTLMQ